MYNYMTALADKCMFISSLLFIIYYFIYIQNVKSQVPCLPVLYFNACKTQLLQSAHMCPLFCYPRMILFLTIFTLNVKVDHT